MNIWKKLGGTGVLDFNLQVCAHLFSTLIYFVMLARYICCTTQILLYQWAYIQKHCITTHIMISLILYQFPKQKFGQLKIYSYEKVSTRILWSNPKLYCDWCSYYFLCSYWLNSLESSAWACLALCNMALKPYQILFITRLGRPFLFNQPMMSFYL